MPRKYFRKVMPSVDKVREFKALGLFGDALFHPALWHLNRRSAAGGVAVGLFCGLIPGPLQMLGAAIVCLVARVNLPVAFVSTLYTNPFTIVPLYLLAYEIGQFVLGAAARLGLERGGRVGQRGRRVDAGAGRAAGARRAPAGLPAVRDRLFRRARRVEHLPAHGMAAAQTAPTRSVRLMVRRALGPASGREAGLHQASRAAAFAGTEPTTAVRLPRRGSIAARACRAACATAKSDDTPVF
jgi:hypothetical protein